MRMYKLSVIQNVKMTPMLSALPLAPHPSTLDSPAVLQPTASMLIIASARGLPAESAHMHFHDLLWLLRGQFLPHFHSSCTGL